MDLKTKKVEDIIAKGPTYKSHFVKYFKDISIALKLPSDAPLLDGITKNTLADLWVEREDNMIVMVVRVDLNEQK